MIVVIGALTGLEVPLLMRIMEKHYVLKVNLSNVLSLDYLGALLATLAFPFLLVPFVGIFQSALIFGLVNMSVGFLNLWVFADSIDLARRRVLKLASTGVVCLLASILILSEGLLDRWSNTLYEDRVVYRELTPYQNIILTRYKDDLRLYLSGHLQFSSLDEYRYHEPLIHVPMMQLHGPVSVLMLGGGDGLAARELLKYERVRQITIVDLDPAMIRIGRENPHVLDLNAGSLNDPRVRTVTEDAFVYLQNQNQHFQLIVADLPDPKNTSLARLYSREFYKLVKRYLSPDGVFVTQATSPFYANKAFWSIVNTLGNVFGNRIPYHSYVPAFGDWGFVMAGDRKFSSNVDAPPVATRFLNEAAIDKLFVFENDLLPGRRAKVSTIDQPEVLSYYLDGWEYWK
jgi:spermidine synthase